MPSPRTSFALLLMLVASFAGAQQVRILVQSSPLAGFQFHAGARIWEQLRVGDALALTREADNAHDSNAVRVDWQGIKLGYLPRSENRAVAAAMDGGARVEGRVAALKQARDPWQRIRIDVMATPD